MSGSTIVTKLNPYCSRRMSKATLPVTTDYFHSVCKFSDVGQWSIWMCASCLFEETAVSAS